MKKNEQNKKKTAFKRIVLFQFHIIHSGIWHLFQIDCHENH